MGYASGETVSFPLGNEGFMRAEPNHPHSSFSRGRDFAVPFSKRELASCSYARLIDQQWPGE